MNTLTHVWTLIPAVGLGALGMWLYMALSREMERDACERERIVEDAIIRDQRDEIDRLRSHLRYASDMLEGEEAAGRVRDQVIDALGTQVLNATPFRVIDGGAR